MSATDAAAASGDWVELARAAARGRAAPEEPERLRELLSFQLNDSSYAVPVERVREIVRIRTITPVPRVPKAVLGVIALRGEIVQVVDLRMRLGLAQPEPTRSSRIIVLHGEDGRVAGVLVDAVREVLRVTEEFIRPAPPGETISVAELCLHGDEFVSIIDLDRVLKLVDDR
ncbi:MAG: chemotaxis protein CheW [Proteobacteria bacterium]|nr:chemotaxis protein CheW [Pseudomonadota bacterium]